MTASGKMSDVGDPIAEPKIMPVVRIHLQAGIFRELDMYLMRAEAQAQEGDEANGGNEAGKRGAHPPMSASMLPWSHKHPWAMPPRIFSNRASSFHTGGLSPNPVSLKLPANHAKMELPALPPPEAN